MTGIKKTGRKKTGLYIHIPFCVRKCNYCAFLSFPADESPRAEYTDALINEIILRSGSGQAADEEACLTEAADGRKIRLDSIYIGGGTPSVLDVSQLSRIMEAIRVHYDVSPDAEITLEANPGTLGRRDPVTRTKLTAYRSMGINRLSMGVQSMDNDRLHFMGRIHTVGDVVRDFRLAREAGFDNISLDLIFSVPGETTEDALDDAEAVTALGPEHISCYSLQLEEGTPFFRMAEDGEITEVPDEEDRETYHRICAFLRERGYDHYEISNFARSDGEDKSPYRAAHNSLYWSMQDYIGCGLGASGFVNGVRYRNISDMGRYISTFGGAGSDHTVPEQNGDGRGFRIPVEEEHRNTPFDNISEAVFTGLRRKEGITYREAVEAYEKEYGSGISGADQAGYRERFCEIFGEALDEARDYADRGLLEIDDNGLRLTEAGIDISNGIMSLFV